MAANYFWRGEAFFRIEDYKKSLSDANAAIHLDKEFGAAYRLRALIYRQVGETEKAKENAKMARKHGCVEPRILGID